MILRLFIYFGFFYFISISFSYPADDWCMTSFANSPCYGAPGKCTRNLDGSLGGFVADTASIEFLMLKGFSHNRPHIGLHASICDNARVYGDARVTGNGRVSGNAWVTGNSRVYENAWVSGNAWVFGNARVYGDTAVTGDTWVFGDSRVFGNDIISSGNYGF